MAQFPGKTGALGSEHAVRLIQGEETPELVDSDTTLVTKDNVVLFADGVYSR